MREMVTLIEERLTPTPRAGPVWLGTLLLSLRNHIMPIDMMRFIWAWGNTITAGKVGTKFQKPASWPLKNHCYHPLCSQSAGYSMRKVRPLVEFSLEVKMLGRNSGLE
jgi:hypothetical protein